MYLINCWTQIIDLSNDISSMAGYVHRYLWEGAKLRQLEVRPFPCYYACLLDHGLWLTQSNLYC